MKNDVGETWIDKRLNLCRQQSGRNNRRGYCNGGSCASVFCHYSACNGIADKGIEEQICSGGTLRNEALHYRYCTCNRVLYGNQYLFQYQKRRRGNGYCCDCSHSSSVSCLFHLKKSDEKGISPILLIVVSAACGIIAYGRDVPIPDYVRPIPPS